MRITILIPIFLIAKLIPLTGQKNASLPPVRHIVEKISITYGAPSGTVESYVVAARALERREGIPASVVIGIAILESKGFTSHLFLHSNNPFGLKATRPWTGPTYKMWHENALTPFRYYMNASEAMADFSAMLRSRAWFSDALDCPKGDYNCFIRGMSASGNQPGWARDPEWGAKVLGVIQRFELDQLRTGR